MIGIVSHIPNHLQEVHRVLSNSLTKGQTLGTHIEPTEKTRIKEETREWNTEMSSDYSGIYILR